MKFCVQKVTSLDFYSTTISSFCFKKNSFFLKYEKQSDVCNKDLRFFNVPLQDTSTYHYIPLHTITFHYIKPYPYILFHTITRYHYIPLQDTNTDHYRPLHAITRHYYIPLHTITHHYTTPMLLIDYQPINDRLKDFDCFRAFVLDDTKALTD